MGQANSATMFRLLTFLMILSVRALRAIFRTREELLIENLALRQQVAALKKERPRSVLDDLDRAFWVALRASWPGWATRLVIVSPDTVAKWNRDRFRRYWAKISRVEDWLCRGLRSRRKSLRCRALADFNIASAISNPLAILDVSTMPIALPSFIL